jgi:hypothetical protein
VAAGSIPMLWAALSLTTNALGGGRFIFSVESEVPLPG